MNARRLVLIGVSLTLLASACTDKATPGVSTSAGATANFSAGMGSTYLYTGHPLAVQVGLFSSTPSAGVQLVTFGTVQLAFTYLGAQQTPAPSGTPTAPVTAAYLGAPTTQQTGIGPSLSDPSTARGVYQATNITFDKPGWWSTTVRADVAGAGTVTQTTTPYVVYPKPQLPAPGEKALKTNNLTLSTPGVKPAWLDSLAQGPDAKVPDPQLHRWTIAKALSEHRPILVIFSTPAYCTSQFCGPTTDAVAQLAKRYANRAVFIHVEIYKSYSSKGHIPNKAAIQWLYRNRDLTEPWLYLIGANGVIQDQWGPLFEVSDVAKLLAALPPMKG